MKLVVPSDLQCTLALSYTDSCAYFDATALTVKNITNTLAGIDWWTIGYHILHFPSSKYYEIQARCPTDEERVAAAVREWLLRDPLASWRRIIDQLYLQRRDTLADSILHYAEELTGMYMIIMIHTYTTPYDASKYTR